MENLGESPKMENAGEQNTESPAEKWDTVKDVEFAGNDSARERFYERYYKNHKAEIHHLVEDFLDQKMAEEEAHHAEEMTRIAETQTDGWTEEDSAKLREIEQRSEENSAETSEENSAEKDQEESPEEVLAKMYEETHQDKAKDATSEEPEASTKEVSAKEDTTEQDSTEEEPEETEDEIIEFVEDQPAESAESSEPAESEASAPENVAEQSSAEPEKPDFGEHGETQFRVYENDGNVKESAEITTPEGETETFVLDQSKPVNPEKYLVYNLSDGMQEAIPRDRLVEAYKDKVEKATDAQKYFETARLSTQIMHEYQDNPEIIAQLKAIESTPVYQKNRTNAELETAKKIFAKRSEDLIRSQEEYNKLNKGGLFKKLMNRMARKTAKSRVEWTQRDVTNAQNDIARLEAQMAQYNTSASTPEASATPAVDAPVTPTVETPVASADEAPVTQASAEHPNVVNFAERAKQNRRFINEPVLPNSQNRPVGNLAGQFAGDDREEDAA